jgi:cytochrome c551/c552
MPLSNAASHPGVQGALVVVLLVHLAWTGLIAGASTAAVAVDGLGGPGRRRLASSLAGLGRPGLFTVAWLEVTAAFVLVLVRIRHPEFPQSGAFWAVTLLPLVAGLTLLVLFRVLVEGDLTPSLRPLVGLSGIGLVLGSCFLLCAGSGVLLQPEAWPTSEPPQRFLLTWSGTGRFAEFTFLSLAATGLAVMGLGDRVESPADALFLRRFGSRLTLVCLLAWPLALLFTSFNLPDIALSVGVWGLAGVGIAAAGVLSWFVAGRLGGEPALELRPLRLAALALLGILVASDQLARANALQPEVLAGVMAAPAPGPAPKKGPQPAGGDRLAAGKAVFDRVCHLCHRFDVKVIGPPLNGVVPRYRKDPAALRAFIRNPVKKDPAYPVMPKPKVSEPEIEAVADYLLETAP